LEITGQVIVASLALVVSVVVAVTQFRDRRQTKFNIERAHLDGLLAWHKDVVATLCDLRDESIDLDLRGEKRRALSSLIEQGRFFFPNIDRGDGYGNKKPVAYRGYRHLSLDFLVAAFNLSERPNTPGFARSMEALQRHFTSMVYSVVNPSERLERLRVMTDKLSVSKESYEQFLSHEDAELLRHMWR
jgi:hypothetical protein